MQTIVKRMNQCIDPLEFEPIFPDHSHVNDKLNSTLSSEEWDQIFGSNFIQNGPFLDDTPPLPRAETYSNERDEIVHSPPSLASYRPPPYRPLPTKPSNYLTEMEMDSDEREQYAQAKANGCID